ncbi:MAG: adenylate/guanylate cyclase domain-containing protein, partial [Treponema sp.]|nr:adenylate/guanylate cyclase domain-containing protein [Treponema sp.]
MKKTVSRHASKYTMAAVIAILVFAVSALLMVSGALDFPEYKTYDFRVRLLANYTRPSDDIIVVLLRQDSLDWAQRERGWGWPWPRKAYAELVEYMNIAGAKSVAFDMLFTEPSVYRSARQDEIIDRAVEQLEQAQEMAGQSPRQTMGSIFRSVVGALRELSGREDDASFAAAATDYGRVVQTVFLSTETGKDSAWPADLDKPLFIPQGDLPVLRLGQDELPLTGAQFAIEELRNTGGIIGTLTGVPDQVDGTLRRGRLFHLFDTRLIPSLAAATLIIAGDRPQELGFDADEQAITWGGSLLPVDREGSLILRFRGDIGRYVPYDFWQILESAEAYQAGEVPLLPPEDFKDKYVLFGLYAPGLYDIFSTPISSVYPGVGMHITMLDNLLTGDFIRESPLWINLALLFAVSLLITLLSLFPGRAPVSVGASLTALLLIIGGGIAAYHFGSLWLPMAAPVVAVILAFLSSMVYSYVTEGSQKRFIKSAFSRYLSPKVIDQIIADPSQLNLGGEKREMTAIFTDIRSFSTISEALGDPGKLVELLNFYLTRMSDIVLQNGGTIDKYEGDAIIAFFGAPVYTEEHARLACRSAVLMHKAERDINREALAQGLITQAVMEALVRKGILKNSNDPKPLFTRLGINTGDMVVGNMGTPNKMDYTIMGDAVNLAARL